VHSNQSLAGYCKSVSDSALVLRLRARSFWGAGGSSRRRICRLSQRRRGSSGLGPSFLLVPVLVCIRRLENEISKEAGVDRGKQLKGLDWALRWRCRTIFF
jgi:hypothetical protein